MRWITRAALSADGRTGFATTRISPANPFVQHGAVMRPAIIELLAQAAAATVSLQASKSDGRAAPIKEGMLVAIRELTICRSMPIDADILLIVKLEKNFGAFTSAQLEARLAGGGDESILARSAMTFFVNPSP